MMINLNQQAVKKFKENNKISKLYDGDLRLVNWEDEMNYLEDVEVVSDEDEVYSDMEFSEDDE